MPKIKLNLASNQVLINNIVLGYVGDINITDPKNGFKSQWKGLEWEYNDNSDNKSIYYRFVIGKLIKDNLIYINVKAIDNKAKSNNFHFRLLKNNMRPPKS